MLGNTYLGNSSGVVLGPYHDYEISAQQRGKAILSQGGEGLFFIRARDLRDAQAKLRSELKRPAKR